MDGIASVEEQEEGKELSQDNEGHFDQAEPKDGLTQDVHPYLGKLEQEDSLVCPESIEEPVEEVDGLIMYQTVEEHTLENSLDTEELMESSAGVLVEMKGILKDSSDGGPVNCTDLTDQVDDVSEGRVDHVSLIDLAVAQHCDETVEKKQSHAKNNEMEDVYSEYAQLPCPSVSSPTILSAETPSKNDGSTEVPMDQDHYECPAEDLNSSDSSRDCTNRTLTFSIDQDSKNNLLDQNELKIPLINSIDTKPIDLKFSLPEHKKPVKLEQTKTEGVCPDVSEVKHAHFFSYCVKSENLVTKTELLEHSVKPETLETKPEDLSLHMKPENLDTKPEVIQFAAYSDSSEDKPEVKPLVLGLAAYPDGTTLKTESKPEGLGLTAFPDQSAVKPEAKTEGLGFTNYPNSSEIKPETKPVDEELKQEILEADSTVLTPKLEQVDGLADTSESLAVKGQVKEERPSTPGKIFYILCCCKTLETQIQKEV